MAWKDLTQQQKEVHKLTQFVQYYRTEKVGSEILIYYIHKDYMSREESITHVYKVSNKGIVQEVKA